MRTLTRAWQAVVVCTAAGALLATTGCQTRDRAGGNAGVRPTLLSVAITGDPPPQLTAWVAEVDRLSKGTLEIDYKRDTRRQSAEFESGLIADVRGGTFDMALVGARAFDRVGVTSFRPLLAPLLVDSLDLQEKVFDDGIPNEMLKSLGKIGLVGVGVWPGPLRRVLGVSKPFTTPADFADTVVGIQDSALSEQTIQALGGIAKNEPSGASLDGLDAYEQQLASIQGNHYSLKAKYVTGNLNLWPRPLVLFANVAAYGRLTDEQRAILTTAAGHTVQTAVADERTADRDAIPVLCRSGLKFTQSTAADLAAFAVVLKPVYDRIAADPAGKAGLERIQTVKRTMHRAPEITDCANVPAAPEHQANRYDGSYRMSVDWSKIDLSKCPEYTPQLSLNVVELVLNKGGYQLWSLREGSTIEHELADEGQYQFFGNQMQLGTLSAPLTVDFAYDGKNLTLTNMRGGTCADALVYTVKPWIRQ